MSKDRKASSKKFGMIASAVLMLAMCLMVFGLAKTINVVGDTIVSDAPEAILASAGVSSEKDVFLSVNYFDQKSDECTNLYDGDEDGLAMRQFEWSKCGYHNKKIEQGLVKFELNDKKLPDGNSGEFLANKGMSNLAWWFEEIDGKSKNYVGTLKLDYRKDGAVFVFHQDNFYPLDEVDFSDGDVVNGDGHNHLFTMNFAVPFTVLSSGEEYFEIMADDDTFVFLGDKLVLDMGGIHDAVVGKFTIHDDGEIYTAVNGIDFAYSGVTVEKGSAQNIRIFHADRDSDDSVFSIKTAGMNLNVTDSKLANRQEDGLQVAYDPTNPTYVAPLGETSVTEPDNTRGYVVMAMIEGVMIVVFMVLLMMFVRNLVKR